jgi:HK97 family phage prohead protease
MAGTRYGLPFEIETKSLDGDQWSVEGYASTWARDLGDDVIVPGAFQKSLGNGRPVRFLYQHDHRQVLGKTLDLKEDDRGLFGAFAISKTALGQDVRTLLRDGSLDSFSIGYLPKQEEFDKKAGVRRIKELELLEVSVVSIPMQPAALVTRVKELAGLPLEDALDIASLNGEETLRLVNALWERRREEGQRPSDRLVALVDAYRSKCQQQSDALLALLTAPATKAAEPTPASQEEAAVDAHLRRARLAGLRLKLGLPPQPLEPAAS